MLFFRSQHVEVSSYFTTHISGESIYLYNILITILFFKYKHLNKNKSLGIFSLNCPLFYGSTTNESQYAVFNYMFRCFGVVFFFLPQCIRLQLKWFVIALPVELRNLHHPRYLHRHHWVVHFIWSRYANANEKHKKALYSQTKQTFFLFFCASV